MAKFEPAVKWSGSKRSQAASIVSLFPDNIDTYYEPFVGGGSILMELMLSPNKKVKDFVASDINLDLVSLWRSIMVKPQVLIDEYRYLWTELNRDNDMERKSRFFNDVRARFNDKSSVKKASDFLFLLRTCYNGMPRYNSIGEFNTSFHLTRNGIKPDELARIITFWSKMLVEHNVEFRCCDYSAIMPVGSCDFVYLDPPYANTKGLYYGSINGKEIADWVAKLPCGYAVSYDGKAGDSDFTVDTFNVNGAKHHYIKSGNSSFRRIKGISSNTTVYESLYINIPAQTK